MKKIAAVLAVCVLLVSLLAFNVHAEGFAFKELSRSNNDTQIQVEWNHTEATDADELEDVLMGGVSCPFTFDEEKTLLIDISGLEAGIYPVVYEYVAGETQGKTQAKAFEKGGNATVKLTAVINDNGTVTVTAKNGSGVPIANYKLSLVIGNMSVSRTTGANGTFTSFEKLEYGQAVQFKGEETVAGTTGNIFYAATEAQTLKRQTPVTTATGAATVTTTTAATEETTGTTAEGETTTAEGETTTTDAAANATTAIPEAAPTEDPYTIVTVVGAGSTAKDKDKIVLNASTDTGILNQFGCKVEDFASRARVYVSESDYNSLTGRNNSNRLMLNVLTTKTPASESQIRAALANAPDYSSYGDNDYTWLTFDLSFLILDRAGKEVPVSALPLGSTYVVELPVPESMKDCKELAVTMVDGNGLMAPVKVAVSGGMFKLEINSLEAYTLIGFGSGGSEKAGGVSGWVVCLFVVGILLLGGAGVLLYFFVLRKPAPVKQDEAPVIVTQPQDDGNDIFSGRTDMPPSDGN